MSNSKKHLEEVDEGYFEHMSHALSYSARLLKATCGCVMHAFIPSCCAKTASTEIAQLHSEITARLPNPE